MPQLIPRKSSQHRLLVSCHPCFVNSCYRAARDAQSETEDIPVGDMDGQQPHSGDEQAVEGTVKGQASAGCRAWSHHVRLATSSNCHSSVNCAVRVPAV